MMLRRTPLFLYLYNNILIEKGYNMSNSSSSSGGIGFTGALTIAFIVLKLTGYITWSWWWVLSPILFVLGLFTIVLLTILIVYGIERHKIKKGFK